MVTGELNVYRECPPVVDAHYGGVAEKSPAKVIIEAVSEAAMVDPVDLPPLYEFVDPDALNDLFAGHDRVDDAEVILGFRIESWNVFVRADGRIRVCDGTQSVEPEPVFEAHVA